MDYLLYQLWPMLLLALIMGLLFGYYTCASSEKDRER